MVGAFGAVFSAFSRTCAEDSWAALGIVGVREAHDRLIVSRAPDARVPSIARALRVDGRLWPIVHEVALPVRLHHGAPARDPASSEAESTGACAGAQIEAEVDDTRAFGTLGWSFYGSDGHAYLMSNWHVLCAQRLGDISSGRVLLARTQEPIARLHAFARVRRERDNTWDLAIARYDRPSLARGVFAKERRSLGHRPAPRTIAAPRFGDTYFKVGAMTSYREARFAGVGAHAVALGGTPRGLPFVRLSFFESIGPKQFSSDGDSGSVVVHARSGAACGLLIGGFATRTGSVSVASPLHEVFDVVGQVRRSDGEVLPRLDYPSHRHVRGLEWVRVNEVSR